VFVLGGSVIIVNAIKMVGLLAFGVAILYFGPIDQSQILSCSKSRSRMHTTGMYHCS